MAPFKVASTCTQSSRKEQSANRGAGDESTLAPTAATSTTSSASPPPYALLLPREELPLGHNTQQDTLKCIFITLSRERTLPCPGRALDGVITLVYCNVKKETQRMRNFMLYTIDIDYDCRGGYILCDEDRTHFFRLGRWLLSLYQEKRRAEQRKESPRYSGDFDLWLLRAIYAPAYALDLPLDVFVIALVRFVCSICLNGTYQSCVQDVLEGDGLDRLAEKLFFDQHEVMKCFEGDPKVHAGMKRAVEGVMKQHVEQVGPKRGGRQWRDLDFGKHDGPRVWYMRKDGFHVENPPPLKKVEGGQKRGLMRFLK